MSSRKNYLFIFLTIILVSTLAFSGFDERKEDFSEIVKISLREVGNQLLLSNHDTTSLVLPVIKLERYKYQLSFEKELSFLPNDLVSIVKNSFKKAGLPKNYRVTVIQCNDLEVAYSYETKDDEKKNIIPCARRLLPKNCYIIVVRFTDNKEAYFNRQAIIYTLIFIAFALLAFLFYKRKSAGITNKSMLPEQADSNNYITIGIFHFYPEENKLIKATEEISLSKKECELLSIFVANPNKIITRDELMKKVWEDKGVFVGRSLDTYISKLRKKLKEDDTVKLVNIHGVGYKLEVSDVNV